ncbi:MAG TPA: HPF/RaiA family ribosome-associated protein [Pirellulaceae bacterium]|nr:HPF/RaiA family ribosome-associated protein [Pirellulaceae bacterium]HMO93592.1 HPF/RaiA family ribosome-associated protein [Pirellulaceae bacterium]HMP70516.1 HPF/RaiA family ribosome-associated protein [Pirellulaceae bacterium]
MKIQINSSSQIDTNQENISHLITQLESSLERFAGQLTRVELHLTDENSAAKGGDDDIRCMIEARLAGHQPVSVESRSATVDQAVKEASESLQRRLSNLLGKLATLRRKGQREAGREGTI